MKLGTFIMPLHPPEKSRTEGFDEDVDFVVYADQLGFTEAWIGQYLTLSWEPVPSNDVFLANLIARTKNIILAAGVSILPQHHPANVAARAATLDHLLHGRFYWGFGQGGVPTDWKLTGIPPDPKIQGQMTGEALDVILKIWTLDPPFNLSGKFWQCKVEDNYNAELEMGYPIKPYQQPHPPIGMTLMAAKSKGGWIGGQKGYMPLSTNLVHHSTVAEHWRTYCAGAADAGRPDPDRNIWRISRSIFVGESDDQAWGACMNGTFARSFEYMIALLKSAKMLDLVKRDSEMPDAEVTTEYMLKEICLVGSKQSVQDQLAELFDITGGFGTLLFIKHDFDDLKAWKRCMEVLANEIVPAAPSC